MAASVLFTASLSAKTITIGPEDDLKAVAESAEEDDVSSLTRPATMSEDEWKNLLNYHEFRLSQDTNFTLYAKVVDQNQIRVAGAEVSMQLFGYNENLVHAASNGASEDQLDSEKNIIYSRTTNANGEFSLVDVNGRLLEVSKIEKVGYVYPETANRAFRFGEHYSPAQRSNASSKQNREIFNLYEIPIPYSPLDVSSIEALISTNGERVRLEIPVVIDGFPNPIPLEFSVNVNINSNKSNRFDWEMEINANEAKIQNAGVRDLLMAPEAGYSNKFVKVFEKDSLEWRSNLQDYRFFIHDPGRKVYGSMRLNLYIYKNKTAKIRIFNSTNSTGSRNLVPQEGGLRVSNLKLDLVE